MKITISRIETYPKDEPTGFAVGFVVETDNKQSFYTDTVVSFEQAKTEQEAVDFALESLKKSIAERTDVLDEKSILLGTELKADKIATVEALKKEKVK